MSESNEKLSASIGFLENDYNQCFEQSRYYDSQISDIFKYSATFYTAIASIAVGLFQFSIENNFDIRIALIIGLLISLLFGLLMFPLIIRNRVYFVICMRYINEYRAFFLSDKPLGFENKSQMYTNPKQPPFFDILSSQSLWYYALAMLNSFIFGLALYVAGANYFLIIFLSLCVLSLQLITAIFYLKSRESKPASIAVFGKKNK